MERTHIVFVNNMETKEHEEKLKQELDNTRVDYTINLNGGSISIQGDNDALHAAKMAINRAGFTIS